MKIFLSLLKQLASTLDPSDMTSLKALGGALLISLGEWLKEQSTQPVPMGSPVDGLGDDELDEALDNCQAAIVKLGGAVPMMAAGGDRWEKLKQLLMVLLPLLLK